MVCCLPGTHRSALSSIHNYLLFCSILNFLFTRTVTMSNLWCLFLNYGKFDSESCPPWYIKLFLLILPCFSNSSHKDETLVEWGDFSHIVLDLVLICRCDWRDSKNTHALQLKHNRCSWWKLCARIVSFSCAGHFGFRLLSVTALFLLLEWSFRSRKALSARRLGLPSKMGCACSPRWQSGDKNAKQLWRGD